MSNRAVYSKDGPKRSLFEDEVSDQGDVLPCFDGTQEHRDYRLQLEHGFAKPCDNVTARNSSIGTILKKQSDGSDDAGGPRISATKRYQGGSGLRRRKGSELRGRATTLLQSGHAVVLIT